MARGLQAAHERGILHRDVKPANILVSPEGTAKITDFGIAFVRDRSRLTVPGTVMGTLTYMAPEQLRAENPDPRTDIWALGAVLYEMCTGRLPFVRADPVALTRAILGEHPPRPSAVRPVLPAELDGIAEKVLARAREDRYQHVDDLVADLRALRRRLAADPEVPAGVSEAHPDAPTTLARGRSWLGRLFSRGQPEPLRSDVTSTRAAEPSSRTDRTR